MGMCFGVRNALKKVWGLGNSADTALYGELVHNAEINRRLRERGILQLDETSRNPGHPALRIVVTAHGISNRDRAQLASRGKILVDTTCPLVRRAHMAALSLQREGFFVVVVGKPDHVEVRGLVGDLEAFAIVQSASDVREYCTEKIGVVSQTTTPPRILEEMWREIVAANLGKETRLVDTICRPTRDRQRSVLELCRKGIDALAVVGGSNSNNTTHLARLAESQGVRVLRVEAARDLRPDWFAGMEKVGLTAGTSALDSTVDEVEQALRDLGERRERAARMAS